MICLFYLNSYINWCSILNLVKFRNHVWTWNYYNFLKIKKNKLNIRFHIFSPKTTHKIQYFFKLYLCPNTILIFKYYFLNFFFFFKFHIFYIQTPTKGFTFWWVFKDFPMYLFRNLSWNCTFYLLFIRNKAFQYSFIIKSWGYGA